MFRSRHERVETHLYIADDSPKIRRVIGWIGFSNSNRSVALKLLTVAALGSNDDVHGYFASLALITYYCLILLMSGWQSDEAYLYRQIELVLGRIESKFPNGTLWILNREHRLHGVMV